MSNTPKLLIHAGTHGDEYEVIDIVSECIDIHKKELPHLIYVPHVSPSAVAKKTRVNANGNDLNRIFYTDSSDQEVQQNIEILKKGPFDLLVSFHEDPESNDYYIYDTNYTNEPTLPVLNHNRYLKDQNITLLNGLDDPADPELGYEFVDGYKKFKHSNEDSDNGMILVWALNHKLIKHCLLLEIPGKANVETKKLIVESFFTHVLIPLFS